LEESVVVAVMVVGVGVIIDDEVGELSMGGSNEEEEEEEEEASSDDDDDDDDDDDSSAGFSMMNLSIKFGKSLSSVFFTCSALDTLSFNRLTSLRLISVGALSNNSVTVASSKHLKLEDEEEDVIDDDDDDETEVLLRSNILSLSSTTGSNFSQVVDKALTDSLYFLIQLSPLAIS
jgi:hypothetical protein